MIVISDTEDVSYINQIYLDKYNCCSHTPIQYNAISPAITNLIDTPELWHFALHWDSYDTHRPAYIIMVLGGCVWGISGWVREVDNPLISLLLPGSFSQIDKAP